MQIPILREGEMAPNAVDRDAQQLRIEPLELREQLLVQGQLIGADRAPVLGIEHEDHGLPSKRGKRRHLIG